MREDRCPVHARVWHATLRPCVCLRCKHKRSILRQICTCEVPFHCASANPAEDATAAKPSSIYPLCETIQSYQIKRADRMRVIDLTPSYLSLLLGLGLVSRLFRGIPRLFNDGIRKQPPRKYASRAARRKLVSVSTLFR